MGEAEVVGDAVEERGGRRGGRDGGVGLAAV